jgi:hypothetical protein
MKTLDALDRIRSLDPLDEDELASWTPSFSLTDVMRGDNGTSKARRPRRRTMIAAGGGIAVLGLGTAAAASGLLGGSAPPEIEQHLAGIDAGMPADLRYNPDVDNARAVAESGTGVLYMADTPDGGYCLEVASDVVRPRGAVCVTAAQARLSPLEITAPIPPEEGPVLVGGRANDSRITALTMQFADGTTADVPFGLDAAWLVEVPADQLESALANGVTVLGFDVGGATITRSAVPPLRDDDPRGERGETNQPIFVSTVSDGNDLTLVLGIEGRVNVAATSLTLQYPDGTTTAIDVADNGRFHFDVPHSQRSSFADRPGTLIATDDTGSTVATAPVASVAYWRSVNG